MSVSYYYTVVVHFVNFFLDRIRIRLYTELTGSEVHRDTTWI
jgi:hypothetical protein